MLVRRHPEAGSSARVWVRFRFGKFVGITAGLPAALDLVRADSKGC
jgi:hypothetical protein